MKAFVTGATGFVGSHVARLLAGQGAELRLLVRAQSRRENLAGLPAELVVGDLTDAASLRKGMEGCDAVFHVAADYRLWIRDPRPMYAANVEGTAAVIEAALKTGKIVEGAVCYTISPVHSVDYFLRVGEKLAEMGAQILCLKDMAGMLARARMGLAGGAALSGRPSDGQRVRAPRVRG